MKKRIRKDTMFGNGRRRSRRAGFSLIELLLVLVILGTLAALVVPKFANRSREARVTAAKTQIASFETALDAYEMDNGAYPEGDNGLQSLIVEPADARNWKGPYLKKDIPLDPWGAEYIYRFPGQNDDYSYDIVSMGPDGQEGTEDDIANWDLSELNTNN